MLPDTLAPCNGPYRLRSMDGVGGVYTWSHVNDELCTLLHDNVGNAAVAMVKGAAAAREVFTSEDRLVQADDKTSRRSSLGERTNVVCTSAGTASRFVIGLQRSNGEKTHDTDEIDAETNAHNTPFRFWSPQDGSIISSASNNIHISISSQELLSGGEFGGGDGVPSLLLGGLGASALRVRMAVDEKTSLTTSLDVATRGFVFVFSQGIGGTIGFDICLLHQSASQDATPLVEEFRETCLAETVITVEIFSSETHMVHRRSSSESVTPSQAMICDADMDDERFKTNVVFIFGLDSSVDGIKLSMLNLAKHLPENFRSSLLNLTTASADLPMQSVLDKEGIAVRSIHIRLPNEAWADAERESGAMVSFLYDIMMRATSWNDIVRAYPDVAQALGNLFEYLSTFDAMVMSNTAIDSDGYLLHVARLAGVRARVVDLGANLGGSLSPFFSGATSFVGPSHYVAHTSAAVNQNGGGLRVKVCHPVIDAPRVLQAAQSCPTAKGLLHLNAGPGGFAAGTLENSREDAGGMSGDPPLAAFIMVGRLSPEKAPGMFVRAVAVLEQRLVRRRERGRRVEGFMVGTGPLRKRMENLARDLNASVKFAGFLPVDAVPCEVKRGTALVVPSITADTFGMVGPEAMLLGVPVITFGFGGTGELVRHMENGIVVEEPTPTALADALELLAQDTALRNRLGSQARVDALRLLSLPNLVACFADELQ